MKPTLTNLKPSLINNNQEQIKNVQEDVVALTPKINYQEEKLSRKYSTAIQMFLTTNLKVQN